MIDSIIDIDNLRVALRNTSRNGQQYKPAAVKFALDETRLLSQLQEDLRLGTYTPGEYERFYVFEPKRRLIFAPHYRDKIVHHAVNNILHEHIRHRFISDSYACIRGKGHVKAIESIKRHTRSANYHYDDPWVVSIDISRFFYSIDHEVMKKLISKHVKCAATLNIIHTIIDSSPTNPGLPLGNLLSQLMANVYLNELDQYCKRELHIKYYTRYADDIIIVTNTKKAAEFIYAKIDQYLKSVLRLEIHRDKSTVFPLTAPFESLGFVFNRGRILMTRQHKSALRRTLLMATKFEDKDEGRRIVCGALAHALKSDDVDYILHLLAELSICETFNVHRIGSTILN